MEQGFYYCGVGVDEVDGWFLVEVYMKVCIVVGLLLVGVNVEVMFG